MRGARIAEKIQEYISGGQPTQNNFNQQSKQSSTFTNAHGSNSVVKQYNGKQQIKQNGVFHMNGNRTHTSHGNGQVRVHSQGVGAANQPHPGSEQHTEFKGRATSSYGSLQSRANANTNGSFVKPKADLNKSGVSATSNVMLNGSRYTGGN